MMKEKRVFKLPCPAIAVGLLACACGSSEGNPSTTVGGASPGSGGQSNTTSSNTGGSINTGGLSSTGGSSSTTGTSLTGGASSSGGISGLGGTSSATGGASPGSGGTTNGTATNTGGKATGGTSAATPTGGTKNTNTGGTSTAATGGKATGGTNAGGVGVGGAVGGSATGGSGGNTVSTGGNTATGGTTSTGTCPVIPEFENATYDTGKSPTEVGTRGANYFKNNQLQGGLDNYSGDGYAWTFGYVGSLLFTQLIGDQTNNQQMISKLNCSTFTGPSNKVGKEEVDNRAFGDLPLEIFLENGDTACKTLGMARADNQWKTTTTDGITADARYWIDDMYMITSLQVWAYRVTKDIVYLDRAGKTMAAYITTLQKDNDTTTHGLFWHTKNSHAYWARANGWFAAGATELLLELPANHTNRTAIMNAYKAQMAQLIKLQFPSGADQGCWHQVLDLTTDTRSYAESSSTAMFTFALVTGLKNGWLSGADYVTAAVNGWKCLANKTDSTGLLTKVCEGTGEGTGDLASQQSYYLSRATPTGDRHGQGPLLWAATALLRKDCPGVR